MKCKACKNQIPEGSIFCNWCGKRQVKDTTAKGGQTVPKPTRLVSGEWSGQVMVDGVRQRIRAESESEYYAKAAALKGRVLEIKRGTAPITLREAIEKHLADQSNILSPATKRSYESMKKHRFQACMGWNIREEHNWQRAVNRELEDVSAKTVVNAWRLVTAAFAAIGEEAPSVKLPKRVKAQRPWLDYEQINTFTTAIQGKPGELGALLALHSLRCSEILGLQKDNVDLAKKEITVSGAKVRGEGGALVYKALNKTAASARTVPIIIPRLEELLQDAGPGFIVDGDEKKLYDQINRVCKAAGLPLVGVHGLRHSFASLAYHLGWTQKSTLTVGGWSSSQVVDEIYTHNADLQRDVEAMREHYASK